MKYGKLLIITLAMGLPLQAITKKEKRRERRDFFTDIHNFDGKGVAKDVSDHPDVVDDIKLFTGGETALHVLAKKRPASKNDQARVDIITFLVDHPYKNDNRNIPDRSGMTPLHYAARFSRTGNNYDLQVVKKLATQNNLFMKDNSHLTASDYANRFKGTTNDDVRKWLAEQMKYELAQTSTTMSIASK